MRLFRRLPSHALAEAAGPAGDASLLAALQRQAVCLDVARDDRACADNGTVAHCHRCNEGRVRTDEGPCANHGAVLAEAIVVTGDRSRSDIRLRTDLRVTYV